jgi:hypothetical protein
MSQQHSHKGLEEHRHGEHCSHGHKKKLHQDWRMWVIVGLMLGAMAIYLLTLDERIVPGAAPAGNPPATNAPAQP